MGNSFYGGQDARPFIIKKKFDSVAQMVEKFSLGLSYLDVNFEEYVLIETKHKNNPENGMIFRRGYDVNSERTIPGYEINIDENGLVTSFTEKKDLKTEKWTTKAYGAEYIGTIVGPAGGAPHLDFSKSFEDIKKITGHKDYISNNKDEEWTPSYAKLIPGYDSVEGHPNNDIKWNWYSVRTEDNESTTVYLGFEIPYTVFDFTAESISAYVKPVATRETNPKNYFYEQWKLGIPKGVKGDSSKITMTGSKDSNNQAILISNTNYDDKAEGVVTEEEPFPYNVIKSVNFSNEGNLTIGLTGADDFSSGNMINWLTNATLSEDGVLNFTFNNNNIDPIEKTIDWIKAAGFDTNGNLTLTFANGSCLDPKEPGYLSPNSIMQTITWITKASLDDSGLLNIQFNNNKEDRTPEIKTTLNWIKYAGINDKGLLQIDFINNEGIVPNKKEDYPNSIILTSIDSMSISETGLLKYKLTDGEGEKSLQIPIIESTDVSNGKLKIKYKHSNTPVEAIGTLKQIDSIVRDTTAGELIFNYTVGNPDKISFPQDFYLRNKETPPENAPEGSIWAVIETKTIKSQEVSL